MDLELVFVALEFEKESEEVGRVQDGIRHEGTEKVGDFGQDVEV